MSRQAQIVQLSRQGLSNREIADHVGCRIEYVRVAKRRKKDAEAGTSGPGASTLHERIAELARAGVADVDVADQLHCSKHYVRVVRQRAGLAKSRGPRGKPRSTKTEKAVLERIMRLQAQLRAAQARLRRLRTRREMAQQLPLL